MFGNTFFALGKMNRYINRIKQVVILVKENSERTRTKIPVLDDFLAHPV